MSRAREMLLSPLKRFVRRSLLSAFLAGMLVSPSCGQGAKSSADTPEARTFLKHYFSTWSARDMDGYSLGFAGKELAEQFEDRRRLVVFAAWQVCETAGVV